MSVINGVTVSDDNNWKPTRELVRAATMTNGYGDEIGDYVGTRYKLSYKWDELPIDVQTALFNATDPVAYPTFTVTHPTIDGGTCTGTYRVAEPLIAEKLQYNQILKRNVWVNATLSLIEVMGP